MLTEVSIHKDKFYINGSLVYSEVKNVNKKMLGTLMNARFIQGIFDSETRERFHRYGKKFDPTQNTAELIASLPQWYQKGLRAITVGMQGGGNCFTIAGNELRNNPYSADGKTVNSAYLDRLSCILEACDRIGIVVIVSYFYSENIRYLDGAQGIINAVVTMTEFLKNSGYHNVMIEIANEFNIKSFGKTPLINEPQGIVALINIARAHASFIPIGCSGSGGFINEEVCKASDVIFLHGNGETRTQLYNHIMTARGYAPDKPILINEDSQAIGQLTVCGELGVSWGYYNNMTKQEVPCNWEITRGEDEFFAARMADLIGIKREVIKEENQIYFQGVEPHMHDQGIRFPRVAALYPEQINYVKFYKNEMLVYVCYDECFTCNYKNNWRQTGIETKDGDSFTAEVYMRDGSVKTLRQVIKNQK